LVGPTRATYAESRPEASQPLGQASREPSEGSKSRTPKFLAYLPTSVPSCNLNFFNVVQTRHKTQSHTDTLIRATLRLPPMRRTQVAGVPSGWTIPDAYAWALPPIGFPHRDDARVCRPPSKADGSQAEFAILILLFYRWGIKHTNPVNPSLPRVWPCVLAQARGPSRSTREARCC
jgi:hypothetical protein